MLKGLQLKESFSLYMANEIARRNLRGILWNAGATDTKNHVETVMESKGSGAPFRIRYQYIYSTPIVHQSSRAGLLYQRNEDYFSVPN